MQRPNTVHLGTQYYRAPFPESNYWADDLKRMRDSGLDTVQLWVLWGWVESTPGQMVWDDYDKLVSLAEKEGLNVVLSTIAEIQPYWIHDEIPDCHLINQRGQKVQSVNRGETHFGCTPGGCTDHPEVWERMAGFLSGVANRYASATNLVGWDVWNELRWNIEADGYTCYCDHTIAKYHEYLEDTFGSLQGLNQAWKRRYSDWKQVWPGRKPNLPYTDMMAWTHFLTKRANKHAAKRYEIVKRIDPDRPVTVHGGQPTPGYSGWGNYTPLDRGNDWDFADTLDGIGCSSFPKWQGMDDADFAARVENVKSAAGNKRVWLSEVQGGRASNGLQVHKPVPARDQQRWIWNGYACGADTILFWCWRDEVFGRESAGFGIIGKDGLAEERCAALKITGDALKQHGPLLAGYQPDPVEVGVLFSPQSYHYYFAQEGAGHMPAGALQNVAKELVRNAVPYQVLEEEHLEGKFDALKLIFLPRCTALPGPARKQLAEWVRNGGTLVTESECGAFDEHGLYSYPEDRWLTQLTGVEEIGRRALEEEETDVTIGSETFTLPICQWTTPLQEEGQIGIQAPADQGHVIFIGSYPTSYMDLVPACLKTVGIQTKIRVVSPEVDGDSYLHVRTGMSDGKRLLFVFAPEGTREAELEVDEGVLSGTSFQSLRDPVDVQIDGNRIKLSIPEIGFAVLAEQ